MKEILSNEIGYQVRHDSDREMYIYFYERGNVKTIQFYPKHAEILRKILEVDVREVKCACCGTNVEELELINEKVK